MRVRLLGGFRVSIGVRGIPEKAWRLKKAAVLIKLLALAEGHRLHREQVMEYLWPTLAPEAASNNLRQAIYAARRALTPDSSVITHYLPVRDGWLALSPEEPLWVDVEAFEEAAKSARRVGEPSAYRVALELYAGELLPEDRYETWAEGRREALRQTHLALLIELAGLHEEQGEWEPAIAALGRVVEVDPAHEVANVGLMRLHATNGKRRNAILQYQSLRRVLSEELGAEPGESARLLYERIVAGDSMNPSPSEGEGVVAPARRSRKVPGRNNLPAERTSFVGREEEMVEVERLLSMTRLLTLTGAGGVGKSRFALALAKRLADTYPDGAWLVELAPLSEGKLLAQTVAEAVGGREEPGRPSIATLKEHLWAKKMLLIFDNCEHLIEDAARLSEAILDSCSDLRIVATSREALNVGGELTWRVQTLSVPDPGHPLMLGNLAGYESVRLFVERARYRQPAFDLTSENAGPVTEDMPKAGRDTACDRACCGEGGSAFGEADSRQARDLPQASHG
jgi:DNA-binding SARP family transcriptional activator